MRICVLIGFLFLSFGSSGFADDYKDTVDAAYCVGSLRRQNELTKILFVGNTSEEVAMRRDAELQLFERQSFVEGAIKQGKLDGATATKMINVGYADTDFCIQLNSKCGVEHIARLRSNVDMAASEAQVDDCTRPIMATCRRIRKCDG